MSLENKKALIINYDKLVELVQSVELEEMKEEQLDEGTCRNCRRERKKHRLKEGLQRMWKNVEIKFEDKLSEDLQSQSVPQMTVSNNPVTQSSKQQSSPGTGSVAPSVDSEKQKLIQLFRADKCQRHENQSHGVVRQCSIPSCQTMKDLLENLSNGEVRQCSIHSCQTMKDLLENLSNGEVRQCSIPRCQTMKDLLENLSNGEVRQCSIHSCQTMKDLLKHLPTCRAAKSCGVPHYSISQMISHCMVCSKQQGSPGTFSVAPSVDTEKQKPIQLFHADKCQRHENQSNEEVRQCSIPSCQTMKDLLENLSNGEVRQCSIPRCQTMKDLLENQSNGEVGQCSIPSCQTMKDLLKHLPTCRAAKSCGVPHNSIRQMTSHCMVCSCTDCFIELPMKQACDSRQQQAVNQQTQCSPQSLNHVQTSQQSRVLLRSLIQESNTREITNNTAQSFLIGENLQSKAKVSNAALLNSKPKQVPENPIISKDWHQSVTQHLRYLLFHRIVRGLSESHDGRMITLIAHVIKIEDDAYEAANSANEYYQLLAEKVCGVGKELEEERQKRKSNFTAATTELPPFYCNLVPPNAAAGGSGLFSSSGSQSSNSINDNRNINQGQSKQAPDRRNPLPLVSLQQPQLSHAHFNSMNKPVTTIASSPVDLSTLSGISVSQFNSSQQNHSQMLDAFKTRQIAMSQQHQPQASGLLSELFTVTPTLNPQMHMINQQQPQQPDQNQVPQLSKQQNQVLVDQLIPKSQPRLSPQMSSLPNGIRIPQSSGPQPTPVQQSPRKASVPGTYSQTPQPPPLVQTEMQNHCQVPSSQHTTLNLENGNEDYKSVAQEGDSSDSRIEMQQNTPVYSISDDRSVQTGGNSNSEKMEMEFVKQSVGKQDPIVNVKPSGEPISQDANMDVKEPTEDGFSANSSFKEEQSVIRKGTASPTLVPSVGESSEDTELDSSSVGESCEDTELDSSSESTPLSENDEYEKKMFKKNIEEHYEWILQRLKRLNAILRMNRPELGFQMRQDGNSEHSDEDCNEENEDCNEEDEGCSEEDEGCSEEDEGCSEEDEGCSEEDEDSSQEDEDSSQEDEDSSQEDEDSSQEDEDSSQEDEDSSQEDEDSIQEDEKYNSSMSQQHKLQSSGLLTVTPTLNPHIHMINQQQPQPQQPDQNQVPQLSKQQSQVLVDQLMPKSQPRLSPQMSSLPNGNHIPQSYPQPTPVQEPPRATSLLRTYSQTLQPPPVVQTEMQNHCQVPSSQHTTLNVENGNEDHKSVSQEGDSSDGRIETQQNTPVYSISDHRSVQTGENSNSENMEIEVFKHSVGNQDPIVNVKPSGEPISQDANMDVKEPTENGFPASSSFKEEQSVIRKGTASPTPVPSVGEISEDTELDSSSVGESCEDTELDSSSESTPLSENDEYDKKMFKKFFEEHHEWILRRSERLNAILRRNGPKLGVYYKYFIRIDEVCSEEDEDCNEEDEDCNEEDEDCNEEDEGCSEEDEDCSEGDEHSSEEDEHSSKEDEHSSEEDEEYNSSLSSSSFKEEQSVIRKETAIPVPSVVESCEDTESDSSSAWESCEDTESDSSSAGESCEDTKSDSSSESTPLSENDEYHIKQLQKYLGERDIELSQAIGLERLNAIERRNMPESGMSQQRQPQASGLYTVTPTLNPQIHMINQQQPEQPDQNQVPQLSKQQNQVLVDQLIPKSQPRPSPQMSSLPNGNHIPQSSGPQPTPFQQPPKSNSVPCTYSPKQSTPQPPLVVKAKMQDRSQVLCSQPTTLNVEDGNEDYKSVFQEIVSFDSRIETQQNTPIYSISDDRSVQTGGNSNSEKMEMEFVKHSVGKQDPIVDVKPSGEPISQDANMDVKEPTEDGFSASSTFKEEQSVIRKGTASPAPVLSVGESCEDTKSDTSSAVPKHGKKITIKFEEDERIYEFIEKVNAMRRRKGQNRVL